MGGSCGATATLVLEHPERANVISTKLEARRADALRVGHGLRLAGKLCCIVVGLLFGGIGISAGGKLAKRGGIERLGAHGGLAYLLGGCGGCPAGIGRDPAVMPPFGVEAAQDRQNGEGAKQPAADGGKGEGDHACTH